eukprot:365861-Chlamydomonas_euryale.AAC.36
MDVAISSYRVDVTPPPLTVLTAYRTIPQFRTYWPYRATLRGTPLRAVLSYPSVSTSCSHFTVDAASAAASCCNAHHICQPPELSETSPISCLVLV